MPARQPGTYALIMSCATEQCVAVGRLGTFTLRPGYYVYVGSALGPGGLAARLGRHLRPATEPHWHIRLYLRQAAHVEEIWYALDAERHEHTWRGLWPLCRVQACPCPASALQTAPCPAHLFYFSSAPSFSAFRRTVAAHSPGVQRWP